MVDAFLLRAPFFARLPSTAVYQAPYRAASARFSSLCALAAVLRAYLRSRRRCGGAPLLTRRVRTSCRRWLTRSMSVHKVLIEREYEPCAAKLSILPASWLMTSKAPMRLERPRGPKVWTGHSSSETIRTAVLRPGRRCSSALGSETCRMERPSTWCHRNAHERRAVSVCVGMGGLTSNHITYSGSARDAQVDGRR